MSKNQSKGEVLNMLMEQFHGDDDEEEQQGEEGQSNSNDYANSGDEDYKITNNK